MGDSEGNDGARAAPRGHEIAAKAQHLFVVTSGLYHTLNVAVEAVRGSPLVRGGTGIGAIIRVDRRLCADTVGVVVACGV